MACLVRQHDVTLSYDMPYGMPRQTRPPIMLENLDTLDGMLRACETLVTTLCPLTLHVPNLQDRRKGEVPNALMAIGCKERGWVVTRGLICWLLVTRGLMGCLS